MRLKGNNYYINIINYVIVIIYSKLWVDKYVPKTSKDIIGNIENIDKIKLFLENNIKGGLLITGYSGVGKTLISHIILKEYGYNIVEFNSSNYNTPTSFKDKLKMIINNCNITMMTSKKYKTAIIIDELDGICRSNNSFMSEIKNYIENKNNTYISNEVPIICISTKLNNSINKLLLICTHIKLTKPDKKDILLFIDKICKNENIILNIKNKELLVKNSQYDFRKVLQVLENIKMYFKDSPPSHSDILNTINTFSEKDIDSSLYESIYSINNNKINYFELLGLYNCDKSHIPYLIHQNYNKNLKYNFKDTYKNKLDKMNLYNEYMIESSIMDNYIHKNNKWNMTDYIGILSCGSANYTLNDQNEPKIVKYSKIETSPIFSKINYQYYNLKMINNISRKLNISYEHFHEYTFRIYKYFIFNKPDINEYGKFLYFIKKCGLTSEDFNKSIKLSYLYTTYTRLYTTKKKKELIKIFNNMLI